jgi:hypothetical protein
MNTPGTYFFNPIYPEIQHSSKVFNKNHVKDIEYWLVCNSPLHSHRDSKYLIRFRFPYVFLNWNFFHTWVWFLWLRQRVGDITAISSEMKSLSFAYPMKRNFLWWDEWFRFFVSLYIYDTCNRIKSWSVYRHRNLHTRLSTWQNLYLSIFWWGNWEDRLDHILTVDIDVSRRCEIFNLCEPD